MFHTRVHQTRIGTFGKSTHRLQISKVGNKEDPPKTSTLTREDQQEETTSISTEENMPHGSSIFQRNWWKLQKHLQEIWNTFTFQGRKNNVSPKDKDNIKKKSNVIYWFRCDKMDWEEENIGESSRTFEERYKEHLKAPSPMHEHQNSTGHITSVENFKIIGREDHNMARAVRRPYTSELTIPHWTETLGSTTCHTCGMGNYNPSQSWK